MKKIKENLSSLLKSNFNDFKDLINSFDKEEFQKELEEGYSIYRNLIADKVNTLKNKITSLKNSKYVIVVPYDRDKQVMSFTVIEDDEKKFQVNIKPCEDCEENPKYVNTFTHFETLPKDVSTANINQIYDGEKKSMTFEFNIEKSDKESYDSDDEFEDVDEESNVNAKEGANDTNTVQSNNSDANSSKEEKIKIMAQLHKDGMSFKKIAKEFNISDKTVARWIRNYEG